MFFLLHDKCQHDKHQHDKHQQNKHQRNKWNRFNKSVFMNYAIMFPGLGADYPNMLEGFCKHHPEYAQLVDAIVSEGLAEAEAIGLVRNKTAQKFLIIQLTIHAINVAWFEIKRPSLDPVCACGHSLGFYAAAIAAGSVDSSDAIKILVHAFCIAWQKFSVSNKQVAVVTGFSSLDKTDICAGEIEILSVNNATQLLLYANKRDFNCYLKKHTDNIMRVDYFPVALPFHSVVMSTICQRMQEKFVGMVFRDPSFPLVSHVEGNNLDDNLIKTAEQVKWHMLNQLCLPINWPKVVETLKHNDIFQVYEVGPNRILSQMIRWIDKSVHADYVDGYRSSYSSQAKSPSLAANEVVLA